MQPSLFLGASTVGIYVRGAEIRMLGNRGLLEAVDPVETVVDVVARMLCSSGLERMVIKSGTGFICIKALEEMHAVFFNRIVWQVVMNKLINLHQDEFAFEVKDGAQKEVAWWHLPAPGTPERHAARLLTEQALAWATP